jgi:hypothetical protein
MLPIILHCPICSQKLQAEPAALRAPMQCPRCFAEFVPIEVIPHDTALPALPVTPPPSSVEAIEPAPVTKRGATNADPPPAMSAGRRVGPAGTIMMGGSAESSPKKKKKTGPAGTLMMDGAAASRPDDDAPDSAAASNRRPMLPLMMQSTRTIGTIEPPAGGALPTLPPGSTRRPSRMSSVTRSSIAQLRAGSIRVSAVTRSSIAQLRVSGRVTTLEIAQLASVFEQSAGKRARRSLRYHHVIWLGALVAGLAMLVVAAVRYTPVRIAAGGVAALSLAVMIAGAVAYGLVRWHDRVADRGPSSGVSVEALAAYAAISVRSHKAGISSMARIALGVGVLVVGMVSVGATYVLAEPAQRALEVVLPPPPPPPPPEPPAPPEPEAPTLPPADEKLRREGHVFVHGGLFHAPESFHSDDGAFDLVVHFHGNALIVEESVNAAKINALVYIVNLGIGSGPYEDRYAVPGVFAESLSRIRITAEKRGLRDAKLRRVAISAWSAGYGAAAKILESKKNFEQVDALLLLDGLHASYLDKQRKRDPNPAQIEMFMRFAKEAAEGKKLFTMTHSATRPPEYASVTETADVILKSLGVERIETTDTPPQVTLPATEGVMTKKRYLEQTTEARKGGLRVRGYVGQTPDHHISHIVQMSATLLPELAERWK